MIKMILIVDTCIITFVFEALAVAALDVVGIIGTATIASIVPGFQVVQAIVAHPVAHDQPGRVEVETPVSGDHGHDIREFRLVISGSGSGSGSYRLRC